MTCASHHLRLMTVVLCHACLQQAGLFEVDCCCSQCRAIMQLCNASLRSLYCCAVRWAAGPRAATPTATARTAAAPGRRSCSSRTSGGGGGGTAAAAAAAGPGHLPTGRRSPNSCTSPADTMAPFEGMRWRSSHTLLGWATSRQNKESVIKRPFLNTFNHPSISKAAALVC